MIRLLIAAAAAGWITSIPGPQSGSPLVVNAVRFYRSDQNRTRVRGLIEIPMSLVQPAGGQASPVSYTVSVRVADSTGLTLFKDGWHNRTVPLAGAAEAYTVEIVDFAVAPGAYLLEVQVVDSATQRAATSSVPIQALSARDAASDLLLAPGIRVAPPTDTIPQPGEFRSGQYLVTAAARVRLTPLQTRIYYLLEAYADSEQAGTLSVSIRDSSGSATVVRTPDLKVQVGAGGGVLKGQLDLAGLPEGAYSMVATLKLGGRDITRSAEFTMAGLQETVARAAEQREAARETDQGYFGVMTGAQLDSAEAALGYIAESRELAAWSRGMSVAAKRRFLTEFWTRRDPTPGTDRNERREGFYEAIAYADRTYKEGGRKTVPGWRSDRGRVYAKYGKPDDVLRRQQEGQAPPYEVWRYSTGKGAYYIFVDRTGFGAYQLVHSNDLSESGVSAWTTILGRRAVADAGQFVGVDLLSQSRQDELQPRQRF
jgi:GWxTD domain-containing protein